MEALGGLGRRARKLILFAARRAVDKKRGRDGTKYSRVRPASFLSHHLSAVASAVVMADARNILIELVKVKQRAFEVRCMASAMSAPPTPAPRA